MRKAWSAPSQATLTKPMSWRVADRAVTHPRECCRTWSHHPTTGRPPCDCVRSITSRSVTDAFHSIVISSFDMTPC